MIEAILQILVMLLVAFLLGFVIAWLWRQRGFNLLNREMSVHRKRLADANQSLEEVKNQNQSLQEEMKQKANEGSVDYRALRAELAKTKHLNLSLNNENTELERQNNLLQDQVGELNKNTATSGPDQQLRAALSRLESRNSMLEGNINDLEERNQWLMDHRSEVADGPVEDPELERFTEAFPKMPPAPEPAPSFIASLGIIEAHGDQQDDLKKIHGVGPYIEQKLNDIGICTYEQISGLDGEQIKKITEAIAFFPGRIERDDWMSQAKSLMSTHHS